MMTQSDNMNHGALKTVILVANNGKEMKLSFGIFHKWDKLDQIDVCKLKEGQLYDMW